MRATLSLSSFLFLFTPKVIHMWPVEDTYEYLGVSILSVRLFCPVSCITQSPQPSARADQLTRVAISASSSHKCCQTMDIILTFPAISEGSEFGLRRICRGAPNKQTNKLEKHEKKVTFCAIFCLVCDVVFTTKWE